MKEKVTEMQVRNWQGHKEIFTIMVGDDPRVVARMLLDCQKIIAQYGESYGLSVEETLTLIRENKGLRGLDEFVVKTLFPESPNGGVK